MPPKKANSNTTQLKQTISKKRKADEISSSQPLPDPLPQNSTRKQLKKTQSDPQKAVPEPIKVSISDQNLQIKRTSSRTSVKDKEESKEEQKVPLLKKLEHSAAVKGD